MVCFQRSTRARVAELHRQETMRWMWKTHGENQSENDLQSIILPVVPARGGAEVALKIYMRPFSSIELACAVRQPSPCVRALCQSGVLFHMSHFKLDFTLHTSHCTLHTPHYTLHSSHCTLGSQHFTLHTSQSTLHTSHFSLLPSRSKFHTSHSTLHTALFALQTSHFTLQSPHFSLLTSHCFLHTPNFTLHTALFTPHTSHCTLHTPHFILSQLISSHRENRENLLTN